MCHLKHTPCYCTFLSMRSNYHFHYWSTNLSLAVVQKSLQTSYCQILICTVTWLPFGKQKRISADRRSHMKSLWPEICRVRAWDVFCTTLCHCLVTPLCKDSVQINWLHTKAIVSRICSSVGETAWEIGVSEFYPSKSTFDTVLTSYHPYLKSRLRRRQMSFSEANHCEAMLSDESHVS